MNLLIVILNYRVTELTLDCLRSVAREIGSVPGARVAVVENGSGGDAAERLALAIAENGWGAWCELHLIHPNRGFTGGNNLVIRPALASSDRPEYVLLLNADTILRAGALSALVSFMDAHPRAGVAGSRLLGLDGTVQGSPFRFIGVVNEFDRALRLGIVSKLLSRWWVAPPAPDVAAPAEWVSGASMILRSEMLDEVGLLDEGLYTYYDDVDLCLRARRAGWQTWYVPESRVVHLEGASTGLAHRSRKRRPDYWHEARRRYFLKNHGAAYAALADAAFIVGFALWRLRRPLQGKPDTDPPHLLRDAIRHSVFVTGFTVREVRNPALAPAAASSPPSDPR
jgi:GT2 family glycosyltransferase